MCLKKSVMTLTMSAIFLLQPMTAKADTLTIVNQTLSQIRAIYISDSGSDNWEENIIEGYLFPPGNELSIQIQGSSSQFDLRVEDESGSYEEYDGFPGNTQQIILNGAGNSDYK